MNMFEYWIIDNNDHFIVCCSLEHLLPIRSEHPGIIL